MDYNIDMKHYYTIQKPVVVEQEIKKSKFITYLQPVHSEEEAKDFLQHVKKEHFKATHHCSAYIIDQIERSNDDGEPASSAGLPMLQTLKGSSMNYVIAIVVRYFGGIKLGVGGLIRAYGSSVTQAIEAAELYEPLKVYRYALYFPYPFINDIEVHFDHQADIVDREYADKVKYTVRLTDESLLDDLEDITRGDIRIEKVGEAIEHVARK